MRRILVIAALPFAQPAGAGSLELGLSFDGASITNAEGLVQPRVPPDSMGAVGPDHVVVLVNGRYAVHRKSDGALLQASGLTQFWGDAGVDVGPAETYATYDPRVLYDTASQRWFAVTADTIFDPPAVVNPANNILVAVSRTSDPTQGWTGFAIDSDSADTTWADFPTLGINADGVYASAHMSPVPNSGASPGLNVLAIPKSDLLAPTPTVVNTTLFYKQPFTLAGQYPQPVVDLDGGGQPATLIGGGPGQLRAATVSGSIMTPTLGNSRAIPVDVLFGPLDADQPGDKANLDVNFGAQFTGSVVKRNGALWAVQVILGPEYGNDAVRWFQIDADTDIVLQSGVIEDPELDLIYPSVAVNQFEEVVIGMTGSSETQFASAYALGGRTLGGVTTFGDLVLLAAGAGDYELTRVECCNDTRNRWGDYSATVVDPSDPRTFWTFQEYASGVDEWSVRAAQIFFVPDCSNALDDDGDGFTDLDDPGCADSSDVDEHSPTLLCDDGADNDGDGTADFLENGAGDPGCWSPIAITETPQCQDGLNNDNQPGIDFDGGDSLDIDPRDGFIDVEFNPDTPEVGDADPQCIGRPSRNRERTGGCGLGFEVVFLAPLLAGLTRRRRA